MDVIGTNRESIRWHVAEASPTSRVARRESLFLGTLTRSGTAGCVHSVERGDLGCAERMLVARADVLDTVFHVLLARVVPNLGKNEEAVELYVRLALKAQAQARNTLETLSRVKNPYTGATFVRQANFAGGPQLVNNGNALPGSLEANEVPPIELLECANGKEMVSGTARPTGSSDPLMETVGAIDRPAKRSRQSGREP